MGQKVNIYYGVKKDTELNNEDQVLDGHSWIELNGEIFNDGDKDAPDIYHITDSYPNRGWHKSEKNEIATFDLRQIRNDMVTSYYGW